jgi:hypothetical protein
MKKQIGIWLNTEKAVLVSLLNGKQDEIQTIESDIESRTRYPGETKPNSGAGTVLSALDRKITNRKKQQMHDYFEKIMHSITDDTGEIYLFGPSGAKIQFEKIIKKHPHLSSKPLDLDKADKMTTAQMIAKVKKHFNKHDTPQH